MALPPTLETPRLRLVPFGKRHLNERYVAWLNDPEVVRHSEQRHRQHSLASCRAYWESFRDSPNCFWAIEEHARGLGHIGNLTAHVDEPNRLADVGILVGERKAWGQGYGTEAWNAALAYLLGPGALRKVMAGTLATNEGMLRIFKKSGMVEDGRRTRHYLWEGGAVDLVFAARFAGATPSGASLARTRSESP